MSNKFKAGDIVKLKTGSQPMTVKGNAAKHAVQGNILIPDRYECIWSDGKKTQKAVFQEDTLCLV